MHVRRKLIQPLRNRCIVAYDIKRTIRASFRCSYQEIPVKPVTPERAEIEQCLIFSFYQVFRFLSYISGFKHRNIHGIGKIRHFLVRISVKLLYQFYACGSQMITFSDKYLKRILVI